MIGRTLLRFWAALCVLFLIAPILVVIASSFSDSGYLRFPPQQLSLRWYRDFLGNETWLRAIGVSFGLAVAVSLLTTAVSTLAALAVTRTSLAGRGTLELLIMAPLIFPHAAIGATLLATLGLLGWVGTYEGILLAHAVLCCPFAYRPLLNALRGFDRSLEEAAMSLGAAEGYVFRHVTLPVLKPALVTSLLFTFIISFDEVTVTVFLIGPNASTLPTVIFTAIQESASPVIAAISTFLIALTVVLVVALDRIVGLQFFTELERSR